MELFGRGYVVEHVLALVQRQAKETQFKSYVADVLRLIGENVAALTRGGYIPVRWAELDTHREDERSGDEIAEDVIKRIGLKLTGEQHG